MEDMREYLVELIRCATVEQVFCTSDMRPVSRQICRVVADDEVDILADHLISHGVTVQKHGRWVDHFVRDWRCSECGEPIYKVRNVDGYCYDDKPNYCPNCGAKMDLEVDDV